MALRYGVHLRYRLTEQSERDQPTDRTKYLVFAVGDSERQRRCISCSFAPLNAARDGPIYVDYNAWSRTESKQKLVRRP